MGRSSYDNWDYQQQQHDALQAFMNQRMLAAPSEPRHIWKLDGPLEDAPADETPTMAWLHMATFNEERARTAEWDANQLRGQLGLAQQDLIRARNAHSTALGQAHA